jgi:hypothetical protein
MTTATVEIKEMAIAVPARTLIKIARGSISSLLSVPVGLRASA